MAETGQAQPLLHVCTAADPQQPPEAAREEHLIPYVPQIVPSIDVTAGGTPVCYSLFFKLRKCAICAWAST